MKRIVLFLVILAVVGGAAFAFDPFTFSEPIEPGCILLSPTVGVGYGWLSFALDVTAAVDYALPIPVMVGLEAGIALTTAPYGPTILPIMARASWHPNFEVPDLDVYVRIKLGYGIGFGDNYGWKWGGGFAGGGCTGARYFFNDMFGIFGEAGYTYYYASYVSDVYYYRYRYAFPIATYFHTGVTIMF